MPARMPDTETFNCSFCAKSNKVVRKLIAGPGVYICDECVALCDTILAEEFQPEQGPAEKPLLADLEARNGLAMLSSVLATLERVERDIRRRVHALRANGVSWEMIAEHLRLTPEEAAMRFEEE